MLIGSNHKLQLRLMGASLSVQVSVHKLSKMLMFKATQNYCSDLLTTVQDSGLFRVQGSGLARIRVLCGTVNSNVVPDS